MDLSDNIADRHTDIPLSRWEVDILRSVKTEAKSEKKIANDIRLEVSTTSRLITDLMMKGYLERRMKKHRISTSSSPYIELFAITPEGLAAIEDIGDARGSFWDQIMRIISNHQATTGRENPLLNILLRLLNKKTIIIGILVVAVAIIAVSAAVVTIFQTGIDNLLEGLKPSSLLHNQNEDQLGLGNEVDGILQILSISTSGRG